jgi:hypothetical protein
MSDSQSPISTDGVSIDLDATQKEAEKKVRRTTDGEPIHSCGKIGLRGCPCWRCTKSDCAACNADI